MLVSGTFLHHNSCLNAKNLILQKRQRQKKSYTLNPIIYCIKKQGFFFAWQHRKTSYSILFFLWSDQKNEKLLQVFIFLLNVPDSFWWRQLPRILSSKSFIIFFNRKNMYFLPWIHMFILKPWQEIIIPSSQRV